MVERMFIQQYQLGIYNKDLECDYLDGQRARVKPHSQTHFTVVLEANAGFFPRTKLNLSVEKFSHT